MPSKREWNNKDSQGVELDFSQDIQELPEDEQLKIKALQHLQGPAQAPVIPSVSREPQSLPVIQQRPIDGQAPVQMTEEQKQVFGNAFHSQPSVMQKIKALLGK